MNYGQNFYNIGPWGQFLKNFEDVIYDSKKKVTVGTVSMLPCGLWASGAGL
jgi:hypothetical protein